MSSSTFDHHFRPLTGKGPLQYQKWIRLNEARRLMRPERLDAASASFRVGYASPARFNREYSRLFGNSARRDIDSLRSGCCAVCGRNVLIAETVPVTQDAALGGIRKMGGLPVHA
ncbi:AraC family transcriptional regulator [Burkholderia sp. BCC0405]|uniref:helix-turn-helix domain-containing protein n=1 Tax=Burkholderia sp. BCC0405 TaxID=2676298 RepID=UPI001FC8DD38|nr:AraC family transcriptional regulator [Burkholderia sp. BCC0405]